MLRAMHNGEDDEVGKADRFLVRAAVVLALLRFAWRQAPPPLRVIVWALVALPVGAILALGRGLGLQVPLRQVLHLGMI